MVHFSKHNYDLAENISPIFKRYNSYYRIFKKFEFTYSPLIHFQRKSKRKLFTTLGIIKRRILVSYLFQCVRKQS